MKEIISVNMSKFLSVKGTNVNILLNVIILAVNQVKLCKKKKEFPVFTERPHF
jgi:hypothetical protein